MYQIWLPAEAGIWLGNVLIGQQKRWGVQYSSNIHNSEMISVIPWKNPTWEAVHACVARVETINSVLFAPLASALQFANPCKVARINSPKQNQTYFEAIHFLPSTCKYTKIKRSWHQSYLISNGKIYLDSKIVCWFQCKTVLLLDPIEVTIGLEGTSKPVIERLHQGRRRARCRPNVVPYLLNSIFEGGASRWTIETLSEGWAILPERWPATIKHAFPQ